jgi:DnaK suppressor protein
MNEELTQSQREELQADLQALRDSLSKSLGTHQANSQPVELDQSAVGRVSRIDAIQQQQMADAQKRRNELRLKQVAVALRGFDDDSYGDCKVCGDPIGYRRLKARPESPACVGCMAELEAGR